MIRPIVSGMTTVTNRLCIVSDLQVLLIQIESRNMASDPHDFTQGLRIRQTYCVPRNFSHGVENPNEIQIWRKMVDPRKCPGDRPQRIQDCKRLPCPAKWVSLGKLYLLF